MRVFYSPSHIDIPAREEVAVLNYYTKSTGALGFLVVLILIPVSLSSVRPAYAQQRPRVGDREGPLERMRRERQARHERERDFKVLEDLGKSKPREEKNQRVTYERIRQDFRRLQITHNEMMATTFSGKSPKVDAGYISKATAEINKRASSLKTYLRLPSPNEDEQKPEAPDISSTEQLKSSLFTLDDLVVSFVTNPTFETPGVVNVEQSAKAARDLDGIINLSRKIKQGADRLKN